MSKCKSCGKKSLFLKTNVHGLCNHCADQKNRQHITKLIKYAKNPNQPKLTLDEIEELQNSQIFIEGAEQKTSKLDPLLNITFGITVLLGAGGVFFFTNWVFTKIIPNFTLGFTVGIIIAIILISCVIGFIERSKEKRINPLLNEIAELEEIVNTYYSKYGALSD